MLSRNSERDRMDLIKAIRHLYAEKGKLEQAIAVFEELSRTAGAAPITPKARGRRGRKSMGAKERQEVSMRMKRYWAGRRERRQGGATAV